MSTPAAIGLRAHSGWAAAVALTGSAEAPVPASRRRIEMREHGAAGPSQPYHAAAGLDLCEAEQLVERSAASAAGHAADGLRGMVEDLRARGHRVTGCGLLLGSGRPLPPLERILAAHPLLHTAEGELFREALRAAGRTCGLPIAEVKERDLITTAAARLHLAPAQLERHIATMGKAIGPPWRQDEKFAAIAAWLALHGR